MTGIQATFRGVVPASGWWAMCALDHWPYVWPRRVIAWRVEVSERAPDRGGIRSGHGSAWVVDERPGSWVELDEDAAELLGHAYGLGRFHPRWRRAAREACGRSMPSVARFLADEG